MEQKELTTTTHLGRLQYAPAGPLEVGVPTLLTTSRLSSSYLRLSRNLSPNFVSPAPADHWRICVSLDTATLPILSLFAAAHVRPACGASTGPTAPWIVRDRIQQHTLSGTASHSGRQKPAPCGLEKE
jgi:hypothetical protein